MKSIIIFSLIALTLLPVYSQGESPKVILWEVNRLDTIGGLPVTLIGNPVIIETEEGYAVEFDGVDDGLLIESNPLAGATEFSIEIVFKPYPGGLDEQRFVHMEQDNDNRVLIELRSKPDENWFLDTFIKSVSSSKTLYAEDDPHASNEWWHACLVYKNGLMRHYVNGIEELSGEVNFLEVSSGKTSLGVRQNLVSWYKGAIKTLKVTHKALSPEEFLYTDTITDPPDFIPENPRLVHKPVSIVPNPVIDEASLFYSVQKTAPVALSIYSPQFNKIANLVNEIQSQGTHSIEFSRGTLPSGLYFYSILIDDRITTNKFLILD